MPSLADTTRLVPAAIATAYPGSAESPTTLAALADTYRDAALTLVGAGPRDRLRSAPARLLALQAIELYLNAYLLRHGTCAAAVRGMQHDLAARITAAGRAGLVLRRRTATHCLTLVADREYLVTRYAPTALSGSSELNRLIATLQEVARKTVPPPDAP